MTWRICRFCRKDGLEESLIHYSVRSYAHGECFFAARGIDALRALPSVEAAKLQVFTMKALGVDAVALYTEAVAREEGRR